MAGDFDPIYFSTDDWDERVAAWSRAEHRSFSGGNEKVVREAIGEIDAGLRVVVNIGVYALLKLLEPGGRYLNLYERPVIGGQARTASPVRERVDAELDIDKDHTYFGAVALGGAGVRYYGEYCMVLDLDRIDPDPRLFDRDSYDIVLEPLASENAQFRENLRGRWIRDAAAMVLMRVLPNVPNDRQLMTAGNVAELVLDDQEFIEVHLRPAQPSYASEPRSFGPSEVEEIRESPDEVAATTRMREHETDGIRLTALEREWLLRRENVTRQLVAADVAVRVVTQHGKGYQWT